MDQFSLLSAYLIYLATYPYEKYIDCDAATYLALCQTYLLYRYGPTTDVQEFILVFTSAVHAIALRNYSLWLSLYPFFFLQSFIIVNI